LINPFLATEAYAPHVPPKRKRRCVAGGRRQTAFGYACHTGDGDAVTDEFEQSPGLVIKHVIGTGVSLPWNLALAALISLSLLFTRVTLGADGSSANAHHVTGSLVLTVVSVAAAEVARPLRYLSIPLGAALMAVPFMFGASIVAMVATVALGAALIALSSVAARSGSPTATGTA
jgi:hypothetical protein